MNELKLILLFLNYSKFILLFNIKLYSITSFKWNFLLKICLKFSDSLRFFIFMEFVLTSDLS